MTMALLMFAVAPMVLADGDEVDGGITINVGANNPPVICTDSTERSWYPNDQTYYTAEEYGTDDDNEYGDIFYEVDARGDYVFSGETLSYYVVVADEEGEDNIDEVTLLRNNVGVGSCAAIDDSYTDSNFVCTDPSGEHRDLEDFDGSEEQLYRCTLIADSFSGNARINVMATDEDGNSAKTSWTDKLMFNPELSVTLSGTINFGSVEPGEKVTSNTVFLNNVGSNGVVMDMYIASDDYFTDPNGVSDDGDAAICGDGNGIKYDQFAYYATKGSLDSGDNDNDEPGLGETTGTLCEANDDEYTSLTSHSGHIEDMCRVINHRDEGSFLVQGQSMSLTFQLDVPTPCEGEFTDGKFHFVGRVV